MIYKKYIKSYLDWIIAFFAIIILTPIFIITIIMIRLDSKGAAFFLQNRLGKKGKLFKIIKFRSMTVDQDTKNFKTHKNDPRITKVGNFIRKTSIDELPQLFNIIKGDMSFIGPRPPLPHIPKEYKEYTNFERKRFNVKPGISGLAAIKQREVHDWNLNIPLDVEYVENYSFIYDAKLFLSSLFAFFNTDNIYTKK